MLGKGNRSCAAQWIEHSLAIDLWASWVDIDAAKRILWIRHEQLINLTYLLLLAVRALRLEECNFKDSRSLEGLQGLPQLTALVVNKCHPYDPNHLAAIGKLKGWYLIFNSGEGHRQAQRSVSGNLNLEAAVGKFQG